MVQTVGINEPSLVGRRWAASREGSRDRLDIHVRRVLSGEGECVAERMVFCPFRERTLSLDECAECEHCVGLKLDAAGRRSFVVCRRTEVRSSCEHCAAGGDQPGSGDWRRLPAAGRATEAGRTSVGAAMSRDVLCVEPDLGVETLTGLLLEEEIGGVPVVDLASRPIGIISKTDLVREQYGATDTIESPPPADVAELGPEFHEVRVGHATVGEIMSSKMLSLPESASLAQAAALMAFEGVHRVPIVGIDGKIVGILSSLDVLRWLARRDGWAVPDPR